MTDRLLVLLIIAAVVAAIWALVRLRATSYRGRDAADLLEADRPLILAFSTPDCVPCRTAQKPALEKLRQRYVDRVEVREVDATVHPELADRFGILTVPSTVVVGADGRVRAVNYGLALADKLALQLGLDGGPRRGVTSRLDTVRRT
ncbi:MAG: thioredoxin family protein [Armatimonadetes bacterium]|nr:thioredoxin family protein [Armatimonadota bacterium]MBI2248026.1 thioredoxin family protein [Armatimonadota bacterium]MBI2973289.1 thioredoxin family protein [Armatimonadota bacterium]